MSNKVLKELLKTMGPATRVNRLRVANYVLAQHNVLPSLVALSFDTNDILHYKAAWILEFVLEKNIDWLIPHLNFFSQHISLLTHQSAIRPIAKICQWISIAYVKDKKSIFLKTLSITQIEAIVATGFDWMINSQHKVATQAYTMRTLYYFGCLPHKSLAWIHPELQTIIAANISYKTPAYKAQGKMILNMIGR